MEQVAIPPEALRASSVVQELFGDGLVGVYLYGSAVVGGLRVDSDVDLVVVTHARLSDAQRRMLGDALMRISGRLGNPEAVRPLEVTGVAQEDIVPWRYPPTRELLYGEWLRDTFESGRIAGTTADPDLAVLLAQAREHSLSLYGPKASDVLEPVPMADLRKAIHESLPGLLANLTGDERNVILTLARMWFTLAVGAIAPKDVAAEWAMPQVPEEQGAILGLAMRAYRGEDVGRWWVDAPELMALVRSLTEAIAAYRDV